MGPSLTEKLITDIGSPQGFFLSPLLKNNNPSCLNDCRPVAFTSLIMKVFERLIKNTICSSIPNNIDPLQFAYRPNRVTEDVVSHLLHATLTHTDSNNYMRLLFIDYSSTFNTIVPQNLVSKLRKLRLNAPLCKWVLDFLSCRSQVVRVGQTTSSIITLSTGAPQGIVLSRCSICSTNMTVSTHTYTPVIRFADDTVVMGRISYNNEAAYLDEVESLTSWCQANCLFLNIADLHPTHH